MQNLLEKATVSQLLLGSCLETRSLQLHPAQRQQEEDISSYWRPIQSKLGIKTKKERLKK
jgi:hypothetical protein